MSELSRRSGVSLASIKYYRREGLLPAGTRTGPTQATYDDIHVRRLRLIRALIDIGGLTVAATREVLASIDDPDVDLFTALGTAHASMVRAPFSHAGDKARTQAEKAVDQVIAGRAWRISEGNPSRTTAIEACATLLQLNEEDIPTHLELYTDAVELLARHEVAAVMSREDPMQTLEGVVVGTVVGDILISALRRLAHEHWAAVSFESTDGSMGPDAARASTPP